MIQQIPTSDRQNKPPKSKQFFNYYLDPHPEDAPEALIDCIERGLFRDPDNVVWYLFARVAREHPWLVRRYETLFHTNPAARPVILKILRQAGDLEARRFVLDLIGDPEFIPLQTDFEAFAHAVEIDPLSRPAASPADLDLLWCEFRATGSTAPVLRIIDVFEQPDRIRGKLEDWLHEPAPGGPKGLLRSRLRNRVCRKLREEASILCDLERREVVSQQDLDCHCVMQDMVLNAERARKVANLLPFDLKGDDAYIWFKAAARWSLASHAREHSIVFRLCESEAAKRVGRCRRVLLEIVEAFS